MVTRDDSAALSLLQLAMRMGGPREAVWHAIVRKTTAAHTSSLAEIMQVPETMPMETPSTAPTMPSIWLNNIAMNLASK